MVIHEVTDTSTKGHPWEIIPKRKTFNPKVYILTEIQHSHNKNTTLLAKLKQGQESLIQHSKASCNKTVEQRTDVNNEKIEKKKHWGKKKKEKKLHSMVKYNIL